MSQDLTLALTRCAIYTRKSTNKALDHDVNSLVTQREICSAYVKSQQYKGWVEVPDHYDDGGHSGSGLERPALNQLMHDIEAGRVDAVVVYKIDRLSRSLLDFVRLIETFDRQSIALISISQAFDTSDSMGRMILNILLTFSQFERELIAERVRDSIRTRKRHGRIHGGLPPFGYLRGQDGNLILDEDEAKIVRFIFEEFLRTRRYTSVMTAIRERGFCSSVKHSTNGTSRGGRPIGAGTVYAILKSPIFVGEIHGDGVTYKGNHEAIISRETWEEAQALSTARQKKGPHSKDTNHFLAGLLWDDLGRHMLLEVHINRWGTYATYVSSNAMWAQREFQRQYRAKAEELERVVVAATTDFLSDRRRLRAALKTLGTHGEELESLAVKGPRIATRIAETEPEAMKDLFAALIMRVEISKDQVSIAFRSLELRRLLEWSGKAVFKGRPSDWPCSNARYEIDVAVNVIAAERWPTLHIDPRDRSASTKPNKKLVSLIKDARKAQQLVEDNREWTIKKLAQKQGVRATHFARLIRLNYLAPDIVTAIFDGTQPTDLTRKALLDSNVPTDWAVQRRMFSFDEPRRTVAPRNLFERGMWPQKLG